MPTAAATSRRLEQLATEAGLAPRRQALLKAALAAGLPTGRDENWRYANLRALDRQVFSAAAVPDAEALQLAAAALPAALEGHARLVVVDGWLSTELSTTPLPAIVTRLENEDALSTTALDDAGASPTTTRTPATPLRAASGAPTVDLRFAQLNAALAPQTLSIDLPYGSTAAVELVFVATADASHSASHPALQLRIGDSARLDLVERHLGAGAAATFSNADLRIEVGTQARLRHTRLQQLGPRSKHFDTLRLRAHDGAECEYLVVAAGAQSARSTALLELLGREASLRWDAVSLGDRTQINDAFVRVEHIGRGTRTRQAFRGIAAGRSRLAFNGHMIVRDSAIGAASDQSLKALLAGTEAEADVRPQLEIYIDEVRASHGATVGKLDEQMRFYLLSRGLDPATADALLKWAFVEDMVARIALPALRHQVEDVMAAQLHTVIDTAELR
ncbi:MAG: SufD family Fe-S cluster assembly protein [Sinobacteraceae bacterium]|nr:SufD family Fe-S cluster assembly protein [Nevskiaceae bacterium]MCP5340216.1 SufD family Fe-S cluster assembly protein [Nevskiaceae bacterium]MCP5359822.1 SufD family Fe-S cluster assembly protein [Nevskiaceae bacterium]